MHFSCFFVASSLLAVVSPPCRQRSKRTNFWLYYPIIVSLSVQLSKNGTQYFRFNIIGIGPFFSDLSLARDFLGIYKYTYMVHIMALFRGIREKYLFPFFLFSLSTKPCHIWVLFLAQAQISSNSQQEERKRDLDGIV